MYSPFSARLNPLVKSEKLIISSCSQHRHFDTDHIFVVGFHTVRHCYSSVLKEPKNIIFLNTLVLNCQHILEFESISKRDSGSLSNQRFNVPHFSLSHLFHEWLSVSVLASNAHCYSLPNRHKQQ